MKKKITVLLMIVTLFATVSAVPKRSEALIAVASGGTAVPGLIVLGASLAAILASGVIVDKECPECDPETGFLFALLPVYGPILMGLDQSAAGLTAGVLDATGQLGLIVGLIVLDDQGDKQLAFYGIDPKEAKKLGFTDNELLSYEQELPEVNAVVEQISQEAIQGGHTEPTPDSLNFIAQSWLKYKGSLSPDTFSAIQKISALMTHKPITK